MTCGCVLSSVTVNSEGFHVIGVIHFNCVKCFWNLGDIRHKRLSLQVAESYGEKIVLKQHRLLSDLISPLNLQGKPLSRSFSRYT